MLVFVGEADVFDQFKDSEGNFKEYLITDVRGMLSLHEASYLSVRGEDILDEALAFTQTHLKSLETQLTSPLAEQVTHALTWPILKTPPRKGARDYLSFYQQDKAHIEALLKLAKLDFNIVQKLHQKELSILTK
jgi:(-)-germacrene D synthase